MLETAAFGLDRYRWLKAVALTVCAIQRTCDGPKQQENLRGRLPRPDLYAFDRRRNKNRSVRRPSEGIHRAATRYIPCDPRLKASLHPLPTKLSIKRQLYCANLPIAANGLREDGTVRCRTLGSIKTVTAPSNQSRSKAWGSIKG